MKTLIFIFRKENRRELAFILFNSLTETVGESFQVHFDSLKNLFLAGLTDQTSMKVRVEALHAAAALLEYLSSENDVLKVFSYTFLR